MPIHHRATAGFRGAVPTLAGSGPPRPDGLPRAQRPQANRAKPVLAAARSIISLGVSYAVDAAGSISVAGRGGQGTARPTGWGSSDDATESRPAGSELGVREAIPDLNPNPNLNLNSVTPTSGLRGKEAGAAGVGEIARYARFSDYHDVAGRASRRWRVLSTNWAPGRRARCGMWIQDRCWSGIWPSAPGWGSSANTPT